MRSSQRASSVSTPAGWRKNWSLTATSQVPLSPAAATISILRGHMSGTFDTCPCSMNLTLLMVSLFCRKKWRW